MASVNFQKCKAGTGGAVPLMRHCDKEERLRHNHSNEHIDKKITPSNSQWGTYRDALRRFRDRLNTLDSTTNTNKRKDRVECFALETAVPIEMQKCPNDFAAEMWDAVAEQYGEKNIVSWYVHRDEVHDYIDHGKIKKSLVHVHMFVVPEREGKLNGKWFSSRQNMQKLNKTIDERLWKKYGIAYMTGDEPRHKTVEELKLESFQEAEDALDETRTKLETAQEQLSETNEEIKTAQKRLSEEKSDVIDLRSEKNALKGEINALKDKIDTLKDNVDNLKGEKETLKEQIGNLQHIKNFCIEFVKGFGGKFKTGFEKFRGLIEGYSCFNDDYKIDVGNQIGLKIVKYPNGLENYMPIAKSTGELIEWNGKVPELCDGRAWVIDGKTLSPSGIRDIATNEKRNGIDCWQNVFTKDKRTLCNAERSEKAILSEQLQEVKDMIDEIDRIEDIDLEVETNPKYNP